MGSVYQSLGLYEIAELQKREALEILRRESGDETLEVGRSLESLSGLAFDRANYESAEALAREALTIYQRLHEGEHLDIASALSDVGVALSGQGDAKGARELYVDALAMARRLPDVEERDLEGFVRRLAIVLDELGDEQAESLYRESLELCRRIYGEEHARVAFALDNLAIFFDLSGHPKQAEPLYRESLAMLRRIYGEKHVEVAQTMGNLADFLLDVRGPREGGSAADVEEMESLLHGALQINRRFRPQHPIVGDNLSSLAALESQRADHRKAETLAREALGIYRAKLSESHSRTASQKVQLGEILLSQGRPREAQSLALEAFRALRSPDRNPDDLEEALGLLVRTSDELGRKEAAKEYRALLEELSKDGRLADG